MSFPIPENEAKRLEALQRYGLLDTPAEQSFDDFAKLASFICDTPIASVTFIDATRQWFKAKVGLTASETAREDAFCAHTILSTDLLMVPDATADSRFANNPLVTSDPHIRFYAGAPLVDSNGFGIGSLCVIDRKPRQLSEEQQRALAALARQVVAQVEFRRISAELAGALAEVKTLRGLLPICAHCKKIRDDQGYWSQIEHYIEEHSEAAFSHGICEPCIRELYPEVADEVIRRIREDESSMFREVARETSAGAGL
jgi:hypothetical protein